MSEATTKPRARKAPAKKAPAKSTAKKAPAAKPAEQDEAKGRKSSVVTPDVVTKITAAVKKAGPDGISLKELVEATGLEYRQVHNATWRMEGSPKDGGVTKPDERVLTRVNTGRKVLYGLRQPGDSAVMRGKFATRGSVEE